MSFTNQRLIPANTTLLQPGSKFYRISDALNAQAQAVNTAATSGNAQIASLQSQVTSLESQVATLQAQVAALQGSNTTFTQFMASFSYLQAEVSTGTIFLDQNTIYKRSFVINNALNTALTVFTFAHGITSINYIVNAQLMAVQAGGQQLPITFLNLATAPNISIGVSAWADATNIYISVASTTFPNYQVLATLWYTATDR